MKSRQQYSKTLSLLLLISFSFAFQPQTKEELQTAVDMWMDDNATALATYGEINNWDVSLITDMSWLFYNKQTFNDDISNWDVSNVTLMSAMFKNASSFSGDISSWDVSNIIKFNSLFFGATSFNQDISGWDVSSATHTHNMFSGATSFNQDLSNWDISNVISINNMFLDADALSEENQCAIHTSFSSNSYWPYDWSGNCDDDGDGVINADEIAGCTDEIACNYNSSATDSDDCLYLEGDCDECSGETDGTGTIVDNDADDDGVCDSGEIAGCQDPSACNYNAAATDAGTCSMSLILI